MPTITVPCATRSGTGWATHEDRHTETRQDQCRTCGGTGQVLARPGESRATSWPDAVPGAPLQGIDGLCIRHPAPHAATPAEPNMRTVTIRRDAAPGRDDQTARFIADSDAIEREEALRRENARLRQERDDVMKAGIRAGLEAAIQGIDATVLNMGSDCDRRGFQDSETGEVPCEGEEERGCACSEAMEIGARLIRNLRSADVEKIAAAARHALIPESGDRAHG